jgi:hypothetical protein
MQSQAGWCRWGRRQCGLEGAGVVLTSCHGLTLSLNVMLFNARSLIRPLLLALTKSSARCCSPLVLPTSVI